MRIPYHIGIIPDGNRRWAEGQGLEKYQGYTHGLFPGLQLIQYAREKGIGEVTFYGFTTDNCNRPPAQLNAFSNACVDAIKTIAKEPVSLLVVGDSDSIHFPKELLHFRERLELNGGGLKVNFLVNYGWEWDLSFSPIKTASRTDIFKSIGSHDISRMDMVIRWGGMRRLSGFLPVQSVYSDFFVVDALWPDFKTFHLDDALSWYSKQDITRGG